MPPILSAADFDRIPTAAPSTILSAKDFENIPTAEPQVLSAADFENIPVAEEGKPSSYFDRLKRNIGEAAYGAAASSSDLLRGAGKMVPALPFEASRRQKTATMDQLKQWADQARQHAMEIGIPADEKTIGDIVLTTATRMGFELPKFALFAGSPIAGFGAMAGLEAAGQDASPAEIAKATAAGATTGAVFKGAGALAMPQRVATQAGGLGAVTAISGGSPKEIAESAISGGVLGLLGPGGGKRFRDLGPIPKAEFENIPVATTAEVAPSSTIPPQGSPQPASTPLVSARPGIGRAETPTLAPKEGQIATDRVAEWQALRDEIQAATPGRRVAKEGLNPSDPKTWLAEPSNFPIQNLAPKKTQLQVIDKVLAGQPLTDLQRGIYDRMRQHLDTQKSDFLASQERNPVPMTTGDLNLKVGDEVKIPGDTLRVTKATPEGITLKDGITKTVDPFFDKLDVVGGEDGIKRAPDRGATIANEGMLAQKAGLNDAQMMALVGDTAKAENLRTLADRVSRGDLQEADAVAQIQQMAGAQPTLTEGLPAIEAKNAELLRQQKAQDLGQFARKELPTQAPSLEGESVGSNLFAKQADLTTLVKPIEGEKAVTPPPGGGSPKTDLLKSRVFERLQEEHPSELTGEVTYEQKNMRQDAEKAVSLILTDKQKAYRIAMGAEDAPLGKDGLPEQTSAGVSIAMSEKALTDGNDTLYAQLVKKRSLDQTRRGQEINAEKGSVTDNATAKFVRDLIKARMEKVGESYLKDIDPRDLFSKKKPSTERVTKIIDREVAKASKHLRGKALDFAEAQRLIDSLVCK